MLTYTIEDNNKGIDESLEQPNIAIPNSMPQYKKRLDLLKHTTYSLVFDITALVLGV